MQTNAETPAPSRLKTVLSNALENALIGLILFVLSPLLAIVGIARLVINAPQLARQCYIGYRAFMHRHVENVGLLGSAALLAALTYGLYLINPNTPSLHEATLQVLAFAALLLFITLHATIYVYKNLLPTPFKAFMAEIGEKINAASLPALEELLPTHKRLGSNDDADVYAPTELLARAQFKLKYYTLKFTFRCVRFVLFSLPFFAIFAAMAKFVIFSLNMQPHS